MFDGVLLDGSGTLAFDPPPELRIRWALTRLGHPSDDDEIDKLAHRIRIDRTRDRWGEQAETSRRLGDVRSSAAQRASLSAFPEREAEEDQLDGTMAQAIARHFEAIGTDEQRAGEIYADDAVLEYVQSGERIRGKANIIASRQAYPGRPTAFELHRSAGTADLQVVELTLRFDGGDPHPVVAILEFRDGKVVRERIYIAEPWDPPAYRARWVEPLDPNRSEF